MPKTKAAVFYALSAAMLYAMSAPLSKIFLRRVEPAMMAAFLYLGAGLGMTIMGLLRKHCGIRHKVKPFTKKDYPFIAGMVVLDVAAPIFLMTGLSMTTAANASLLNNFEIVATALIARLIFKEAISKRLWLAIGLVTLSSMILSLEDRSSFSFSTGSIFILMACICWGIENNCTRALAQKDPLQVVVIKGFGSGAGSLCIALFIGEEFGSPLYMAGILCLGFVSYGLSIFFYIYAQRELGAAKTSAYYAAAPFIGVVMSLVIFRELPEITFVIALLIMAAGTYTAST